MDWIPEILTRTLTDLTAYHLDAALLFDMPPPKIIEARVAIVTQFLVWCHTQGHGSELLRHWKQHRNNRGLPVCFDPKHRLIICREYESEKLYQQSPAFSLLFALLAETGVSLQSLLSVYLDDLNPKTQTVRIRETRLSTRYRTLALSVLSAKTRQRFEAYYHHQRSTFKHGLLFRVPSGQPIQESAIFAYWQDLCYGYNFVTRHGTVLYTLQAFRHTLTAEMFMNAIPFDVIINALYGKNIDGWERKTNQTVSSHILYLTNSINFTKGTLNVAH